MNKIITLATFAVLLTIIPIYSYAESVDYTISGTDEMFAFHVNRAVHNATLTSTNNTIAISWDQPPIEPLSYRVMWAEADGDYVTWRDLSGNAFPVESEYTIEELEEDTEYKLKLRPRYNGGVHGTWSDEIRISTEQTAIVLPPVVIPEPEVSISPSDVLMTFGNVTLTDAFGNEVVELYVDERVQIMADIENLMSVEQEFVYVISDHDPNGEMWITGSLSAGQSFSPALSWIPTESGSHTLRIAVFNNIVDRVLLAEPITLIVDVIESEVISEEQDDLITSLQDTIAQIQATVEEMKITMIEMEIQLNSTNTKNHELQNRITELEQTPVVTPEPVIRANTGSISLDRTVYPVPFGQPSQGESFFAVHSNAIGDKDITTPANSELSLDSGTLTVHVRVNDPDYDLSASGEDTISEGSDNGPIKIMVIRGSESVLLGTAGASEVNNGKITIGNVVQEDTKEHGPIKEIKPDAGIFELDLDIEYTDGPANSACPSSNADVTSERISPLINEDDVSDKHCILQGDILQVEYTDLTDASGDENTVTDSATFDLRNGVLQSDKSVYLIGSDMILTLIEPDFDLDNDGAETYDLDLIEWDSDAATTTMGNLGVGELAFDPEPDAFRETGDSTGIFQVVIEIPGSIAGDSLERGEEIVLEYTDWGPSGANYVGDEDEDVNITVFTSNFGATVELDQKVYTWTDKVYITIVAPDHNFDGDLIDEIGNSDSDPLKVSTRGFNLDNYKLVETGTDTGIFTGEVILTGFTSHDADGDGSPGDAPGNTFGAGPTNGFLETDDDDGITVSFEFSEDETVVGSSLIRWNIGETQWLEASYPASGTGVIRVIDPDMNLNPEAVDNFDVDVWSDSDSGGIDLTVTETNEATGIFEGTVFFTVTDESSGHRLRVAEGDTVTAEYEDNTLPDPYTTADELDITAITLIGISPTDTWITIEDETEVHSIGYYEDGSVKRETLYREDGSMESYTFYYRDGSIWDLDLYDENGVELSTTEYRADGSIVFQELNHDNSFKRKSTTFYYEDGSIEEQTCFDIVGYAERVTAVPCTEEHLTPRE